MKKIVIILLTSMIMLTGCGSPKVTESDATLGSVRFERVYSQSEGLRHITVYVDTKTNVMYLLNKVGNAGGITVMLDENGNPLLYKEK